MACAKYDWMLSLVNPRISICWEMRLLHSMSVWRNSLAQGRLVMRTVASDSSLPVMTSRKTELSLRNSLGSSSYPSNRSNTPLPRVSLIFLTAACWIWRSEHGKRLEMFFAARTLLSRSLRRTTSWYCWRKCPFPHLRHSFQAKVDFPTPGAPSTRMHFACDPSGIWAIWPRFMARFDFFMSSMLPWIVFLTN